jgi:hypothetical protein
VLDHASVALEYWLREVVPASEGEPRPLAAARDAGPMTRYFELYRNIRPAAATEFQNFISEPFIQALNEALQLAFKETPRFSDFVHSVILHSLATLLKDLIARVGGVSSEQLVAYADLPLLEQVDRSISPRILVMDTVDGGSGACAQAFERLDLTDQSGSLWWTLQTEMGNCPIASGEALVRQVFTTVSRERIEAAQEAGSPDALADLVDSISLTPAPGALNILGRVLFHQVEAAGHVVNPALITRELLEVQQDADRGMLSPLPREATVRVAVATPDASRRPAIAALREALLAEGVNTADLDYELAVQLLALYDLGCDDGCPVCTASGSDVEHHHLAYLLNSRQVMGALRRVLLSGNRRGECLSEMAESLLKQEQVRIDGNPGTFGDSISTPAGVAVVSQSSHDGRLAGTTALVNAPDQAADFFTQPDSWERRWGGPEFRCVLAEDGNRVRSRAEALIANWLFREKIPYVYEPPLPYRAEDGRTRYIHPDFHLYEDDVYVEYWGRDDKEYVESRRFKENVYAGRSLVPVHLEKHDVDTRVFELKIRARMK